MPPLGLLAPRKRITRCNRLEDSNMDRIRQIHVWWYCKSVCYQTKTHDIDCVHMGYNHVPKDVSDRDPKRDWDRDLNYVRSHALQMPSQSRSGSAHWEVIFCSFCAVRVRWLTHALMHGFSAHFWNAHARITFRKSFAFTCPRIRLSRRITIQNPLFFSCFKSLLWNSFVFTWAKIRLSNQERAESRSETSFGTWF